MVLSLPIHSDFIQRQKNYKGIDIDYVYIRKESTHIFEKVNRGQSATKKMPIDRHVYTQSQCVSYNANNILYNSLLNINIKTPKMLSATWYILLV